MEFSFAIGANGLQLPEGCDFGAFHCHPRANFDRSTKLDLTTKPPLLDGCCYKQFVNYCFIVLFIFSIRCAVSMPLTDKPSGDNNPICTNTLAWSQ
jgi:hypothetical protein